MSAPDKNGWRPISAAPKDGTDVLVHSPDAVHPGIFKAAFFEFEGDPDPGEWYCTDNDSGKPIDAVLSHFQPLPKPPVTGGDE